MQKIILSVICIFSFAISNQAFALEAKAVIYDSSDATKSYGEVVFTDTPEGLKVEANLTNVPNPGKHGFHIHELGSCDDKGNAAGGHYNPMKADHGFLPKDGMTGAHLGDIGNIEIASDGSGKVSVILSQVTLTGGDHNVEGRALILHEKEDDYGQPTGNAGGRLGCGMIRFPQAALITPVVPAPVPEAVPVPTPLAEPVVPATPVETIATPQVNMPPIVETEKNTTTVP